MDADPAADLRLALAEAAQERGMELDESALEALCATFGALTREALDRAVKHLRPPPLLQDLAGASLPLRPRPNLAP